MRHLVVRIIYPWNCIGETEIFEKSTEVDRIILDTNFLLEEALDFLWFPGLALSEKSNEFLLFISAKLRGYPSPKFGVS